MTPPFVHLQVRSHYSLMRGTASLEDLCAAAIARGMLALALTDIDGLYGAVRFVAIARDAGLAPILGATITPVAGPERRWWWHPSRRRGRRCRRHAGRTGRAGADRDRA